MRTLGTSPLRRYQRSSSFSAGFRWVLALPKCNPMQSRRRQSQWAHESRYQSCSWRSLMSIDKEMYMVHDYIQDTYVYIYIIDLKIHLEWYKPVCLTAEACNDRDCLGMSEPMAFGGFPWWWRAHDGSQQLGFGLRTCKNRALLHTALLLCLQAWPSPTLQMQVGAGQKE